jgi:hypothetical protein
MNSVTIIDSEADNACERSSTKYCKIHSILIRFRHLRIRMNTVYKILKINLKEESSTRSYPWYDREARGYVKRH